MTYFTIAELSRSEQAARRGIRNEPPAEARRNLTELVGQLLDPLREAWGAECARCGLGTPGLRVTSGYRCAALNAAVGGVPASAHCQGLAADIVPLNGQMSAFRSFTRDFLATRDFDQLIFERLDSRGVPAWIHLGLRGPGEVQRREVLAMENGKYTRL